MTFFNKKEEVLEIKLSSFGRQKLAAGTFKPVYYAFFDDDVLYDGARAGVSEDNNNIEPRIQENTPSLRVQTNFVDLEKKVKQQTHDFGIGGVYNESSVSKLSSDPSIFGDYDGLRNALPLGNSQIGNDKAAAWKVSFLEGRFNRSRSTTRDGNATCSSPYKCQKPIINIPQIDANLEVVPVLVDKTFKGVTDPVTQRYVAANNDNNKFIRLTKDYILLDVVENNVDLLNDSFSLEVYEITTDSDNEEKLVPKLFKKQIMTIKDGILLDDDEIEAQISEVEVDENFIEYYFNITFDDNIDNKTKYEKIVSREHQGNIFDNNVGFDDVSQVPGSELYTSDNNGDEC